MWDKAVNTLLGIALPRLHCGVENHMILRQHLQDCEPVSCTAKSEDGSKIVCCFCSLYLQFSNSFFRLKFVLSFLYLVLSCLLLFLPLELFPSEFFSQWTICIFYSIFFLTIFARVLASLFYYKNAHYSSIFCHLFLPIIKPGNIAFYHKDCMGKKKRLWMSLSFSRGILYFVDWVGMD